MTNTYTLVCKETKFSETKIIQRFLGIKSGLTMMHYNNANNEGYYWLIPD